jgi:hypothetical protein
MPKSSGTQSGWTDGLGVATTSQLTFNYSSLPSQFSSGNYSVIMEQGTNYPILFGSGKQYDYLGFYTLFNRGRGVVGEAKRILGLPLSQYRAAQASLA